jgi:hypothetical protein
MLELVAICLVIWVCVRLLTTGLTVAPKPEEEPEHADAETTYELLLPHRKKAIKRQGLTMQDFTCTYCNKVATCRSAYDLYNIHGDCLEEK